ncbi:MAG: hypothetical protein ACW99A_16455 [Candidatus Kariarchaeaceae archaeon]|jgi:hypothetical protein
MRKQLKISILSTFLLLILIAPTSAQDEYYDYPRSKYSGQLKAGMEFEWVLSKYDLVTSEEQLGVNQMTTTETSTYSDTTTSTYQETVTVSVVTVTEDGSEFPDVASGTTIRIKLLQDLDDAPEELQYDYYDESDESIVDDYFDITYSQGTYDEMRWFIPLSILITPNEMLWDNGTSVNLFRYQYDEYIKYQEEYSNEYSDEYDDYSSSASFELSGGLAIEKRSLSEGNGTFSSYVEFRYDIDTGLLVYVYADVKEYGYDVELEIRLTQSTGIEIDDIKGDQDPTLDIPISAIFVYTLLALPIITNKFRKRIS